MSALARTAALLVISLSACARDPAPTTSAPRPEDRPAGARTGAVAARVLHLQGQANVDDGAGQVFPALVAMPLIESDTVDVQRGAFTLLALRNDRVVRIDEDLRLKVGDVVLARLPKTTTPIDVQVQALLPKDELAAIPVAELRERVAGWQARMAAADSAPVQARAREAAPMAASAPPAAQAPAAESSESAKAVALDEAAPKAERAMENLAVVGAGGGAGAGPRGPDDGAARAGKGVARAKEAAPEADEREAGAKDVPAAPPAPDAPARAAAPDTSAQRAARLATDAALAACLRAHLMDLGLGGEPRVTFGVRTDGGRVVRAWLGGAIPVPACARDIVAQGAWPDAGRFEVVVPLQ